LIIDSWFLEFSLCCHPEWSPSLGKLRMRSILRNLSFNDNLSIKDCLFLKNIKEIIKEDLKLSK
jgi:hypothetical protein